VPMIYPRGVSALSPLVAQAVAEEMNRGQSGGSSITPGEFGAFGDGYNDDATALNAMFDAIRAASNKITPSDAAFVRYNTFVIDGEGQTYVVKTSLNATGMRNGRIHFRNMTIIWQGNSTSAILDLTDSRWTSWQDVHVCVDDPTYITTVGILQARNSSDRVTSEHTFINVTVKGYFSIAAWVNYAAEVCTYIFCEAWNYSNTAGSYAIALMSERGLTISSLYQTITSASNPFTIVNMVGCQFLRSPSSTAAAGVLYLRGSSRINMSACYAVGYNSNCCVIEAATTGSLVDFHGELHMEGTFDYNWRFLIGTQTENFNGFEWIEHNCHAAVACISSYATSGFGLLNDVKLSIRAFVTSVPIFADPSTWQVKGGNVRVSEVASLPLPSAFAAGAYECETYAVDRTPHTINYQAIPLSTVTSNSTTNNTVVGKVQTEALTTVAGGVYNFTILNNLVTSTNDSVIATVNGGTYTQASPSSTRLSPL
jgi:hypothetical protein